MTTKLIGRVLWETFLWVALFGGVVGLLTGLALIFNSRMLYRFGEYMNRWISTRQAMRPFEEPIPVERAVYRYHRIAGALIVCGAAYALYVFTLRYPGPELMVTVTRLLHIPINPWIGETMRLFIIVVNVFAAVIGLIMIFRPSALKPIEAWANRSYSGRQATRALEIPRPGPDRLAFTYPIASGAILTIAGAYITATLVYYRFLAG